LIFSVPLPMASVICSKLSISSSMCVYATTLYIVPMSTLSCSLIFLILVRSINIYIKSISSLYCYFPSYLPPLWHQVMVFIYVTTFQQYLHMEYISLSWPDIHSRTWFHEGG
jgi:hypothetical protein